MVDEKWLANLKPGDEVITTGTYLTALLTVVERPANGYIVTTWGDRTIAFNQYGYLPNGVTHIIPPTEQLRRDIERAELEDMLRNVRWGACSLDQLHRIVDILK